MVVYGIVAFDSRGGVGELNKLPWPMLVHDMKRFRMLTEHGTVIMGRKTYESLPNGPLKKRLNIVVTRQPHQHEHLQKEYDNLLFLSENEVRQYIQNNSSDKIFIIGGPMVWDLLMEHIEIYYITFIHAFFPNVDTFIDKRKVLHLFNETLTESKIHHCKGITYHFETRVRRAL